ncbi:hypothetical protein PYCC9005_004505 [Savitreella phatthalungensis]
MMQEDESHGSRAPASAGSPPRRPAFDPARDIGVTRDVGNSISNSNNELRDQTTGARIPPPPITTIYRDPPLGDTLAMTSTNHSLDPAAPAPTNTLVIAGNSSADPNGIGHGNGNGNVAGNGNGDMAQDGGSEADGRGGDEDALYESSDTDTSFVLTSAELWSGNFGIGEEEEPVTVCRWQMDDAGGAECRRDLGSVDRLVTHLNDEHLGSRRSKYTCEWTDCPRKGANQTSRFALVAHMRSHTGEKPFFCKLPECDRSFTRSDALAKHMRTNHDMDPLKGPGEPGSEPGPPAGSAAFIQQEREARQRVRHGLTLAQLFGLAKRPQARGVVDDDADVLLDDDEEDDLLNQETSTRGRAKILKRRLKWSQDRTKDLERQLAAANRILLDERLRKETLIDEAVRQAGLDADADGFLIV